MDIKLFKLFLFYVCATGVLCQKIIVHPENITVKHGAKSLMRCEFEKPVKECFWFRNSNQGVRLLIHRTNISNCSTVFGGIRFWDEYKDFWYCSNARSLGTQSNKSYITVVKPVITVHPQNATVKEGDDITLQCESDVTINNCEWRCNGSKVEIDGRYQYSDATAVKRRHTRNCSILIKTFEGIDASYWMCYLYTYVAYSPAMQINVSQSQRAYLRIATMITDHPKNATVLEGGDKILQCQFNNAVDRCIWLRNGSTIEMTGRYRYVNGEFKGTNTKECSIEVTQFSKIDATSWQCFSALNCDIKIETCIANIAYLTIEYHVTRNISQYISNHQGSFFELNLSIIMTIILSGTSVVIISTCAIIYYLRRRSKGKKKTEDPRSQSTRNETSQLGPSRPEFQLYHDIATQQVASEEDSMGYLVPTELLTDMNDPEMKFQYHIYEEIPE